MKRNFVRGFVSILGGNFVSVFVSLLLTPILVRVLGSSQYGQYAVVLSVFGPLMILVNAGLFPGIRKFIGEHPDDPAWRDELFGFYTRVAISFALVGIAAVLVAVLSGVIDVFFGESFRPLFYIVVLMIPLYQFFVLGRGTLMALGLEHYSEPAAALQQLLFKGLGILLVLAGLGVAGALFGYAISLFVAAALCLVFAARHVELRSAIDPLSLDIEKRELLGFNALSVVHAFLASSLLNADVLLIQLFRGSSQAGYYKAALVVSAFLWFVPRALKTTLLHSTAELWAKDKHDRISARASRLTRYSLVSVTLLVLGLGALADAFVSIYYGASFAPTVTPLLLLLPGTFGFALARPLMAIGQANGSLRTLIAATGSAAVINVVLNVLLIPIYGMSGAAVATSVGYGSMLLFHLAGARVIGYDPLEDLRLERVVASGALAGVVIVGLAIAIGSNLVSLLVVPPIGLVVYAAASIGSGAIRTAELRTILRQLPLPQVEPLRRLIGSE